MCIGCRCRQRHSYCCYCLFFSLCMCVRLCYCRRLEKRSSIQTCCVKLADFVYRSHLFGSLHFINTSSSIIIMYTHTCDGRQPQPHFDTNIFYSLKKRKKNISNLTVVNTLKRPQNMFSFTPSSLTSHSYTSMFRQRTCVYLCILLLLPISVTCVVIVLSPSVSSSSSCTSFSSPS